jgi:hypothetical protein
MRKLTMILLGVSAVTLTPQAHATTSVLTFDGFACTGTDGGAVDRNCTSGGYIGGNYGSTAQLNVSYDVAADIPGLSDISLLYGEAFSTSAKGAISFYSSSDGISKIIFSPLAGFEVAFNSFKWVGGSATFASISGDILDSSNNSIFNYSDSGGSLITANTAYYSGPLTFRFFDGGGGLPLIDELTFDVRASGIPGGVPEPASWALMIAGFGLTGSAMRKRKAFVKPVLA